MRRRQAATPGKSGQLKVVIRFQHAGGTQSVIPEVVETERLRMPRFLERPSSADFGKSLRHGSLSNHTA